MAEIEADEQLAIDVLATIMNGNLNPNTPVSTKSYSFIFTYEDLTSDRLHAKKIKKKIRTAEEMEIFRKLRRRVLSKLYSRKSRTKRRIESINAKTERVVIIDKVHELFADHPNLQAFKDFIKSLNEKSLAADAEPPSPEPLQPASQELEDVPDLLYIGE